MIGNDVSMTLHRPDGSTEVLDVRSFHGRMFTLDERLEHGHDGFHLSLELAELPESLAQTVAIGDVAHETMYHDGSVCVCRFQRVTIIGHEKAAGTLWTDGNMVAIRTDGGAARERDGITVTATAHYCVITTGS